MTFSELKTAVLSNLDRSGGPTTEATAVGRWLNQTIREDLCALHYWGSMFSRQTVYLTSGIDLYAWPAPTRWKFTSMIGLRTSTSDAFQKLKEVTLAQALYDGRRATNGQPRWWTKRGDGFLLTPAPDVSTYQIEVVGWQYPAELVNDADTNHFTLYLPRVVEAITTARGWLHFGEDTKAALWKQMADRWLAQALQVDKEAMLPFAATMIPGTSAGRQHGPWGRKDTVTETAYWWV